MDLAAIFPFLLILVAGWLLLIRPQRRRQQEMSKIQSALEPGLEVMLANGLFATVLAVEDDTVLVEAAPGVSLRFLKQAVLQIRTAPESMVDLETFDESAFDESEIEDAAIEDVGDVLPDQGRDIRRNDSSQD
jgi:preprotein translocase subunit YajC